MTKISKSKTVKKVEKKPARKPAAPAKLAAPTVDAPVSTATVDLPVLQPSAPAVTKATKDERHRMVAECAYYISLRKGPSSDPAGNWVEAEKQIDAQLEREGRL